MVRTARLSGSGAALLPPKIGSVEDVPWDLANAIDHGMRICSWQENLKSEDIPPVWMMPFEDELEEWFDALSEKNGTKGDDLPGDTSVPMMGNELSDRFRS